MTERGHTWMARSWGSYISFLLLDDAGPSPVDVDRQEVLEDGEVYDEDESYLDDEDWKASLILPPLRWSQNRKCPSSRGHLRPPSRHRRASAHFRPPLVARRSGARAPLPRLLLPSRSHSPFALLRLQGVVKAAYVNAQRLFSSGATDHAIVIRLDATESALVPPDTSPEKREVAAPWECCYSAISSALQGASRLLAASYAHGLSVTRIEVLESSSHLLLPILSDSSPSGGGVLLRQPREGGPLICQLFCQLKRPSPRLRVLQPLSLHVASSSARRPHMVLPLLALGRPLRISSCFLRFFVGVFPAPSIGGGS